MIDTCYVGDVRDGLRAFIAAGIKAQTCVTSPPYWGLRDYGVPGQLGLESTPAEYVERMVDVFRLVREALADDGTLWLNMGDSYAGSRKATSKDAKLAMTRSRRRDDEPIPRSDVAIVGLKPKDLVGMPWRLAFALQDDGWYLRADVIWNKPNPMPESVTDRPTKAHEYLFLLAKSERYFYDADAIKEPASEDTHARLARNGIKTPDGWATHAGGHGSFHKDGREKGKTRKLERAPAMPGTTLHTGLVGHSGPCRPRAKNNESFDAAMAVMPSTRNKRTVWTIATEPYAEAHFATFPTALVEPCILAGTSQRGHCPQCGKGWERVVDRERVMRHELPRDHPEYRPGRYTRKAGGDDEYANGGGQAFSFATERGWQPTCDCGLDPVPGVVLDPFMGSGTVAQVAQSLGRRWIGCELNPEYHALQRKRAAQRGLELVA